MCGAALNADGSVVALVTASVVDPAVAGVPAVVTLSPPFPLLPLAVPFPFEAPDVAAGSPGVDELTPAGVAVTGVVGISVGASVVVFSLTKI